MKKRILSLAMAIAVALCAAAEEIDLSVATPAPTREETRQSPTLKSESLLPDAPIDLPCPSAILVESTTGSVIFAENADAPCPVASVTKIMTILLALEAIADGRARPEDMVTISPESSGMGGSQALLDTGEKQTFTRLLECVIIASANDAAVAIAEHLYGSESLFVERMNQRAAELGMTNTLFVNCTGLPAAGQGTTARDVAIMTLAMLEHESYFSYSGVWMDELDHGDGRVTSLTNTNKLIKRYSGCDGGKTGSTNEAGYCISATAKRGGMRLVAVVLGAKDSANRFSAATEMFEFGFANYRLYPVAAAGTKIKGGLPVTGGRIESLTLELGGALTLLVAKGTEQEIALTPELPDAVSAPIQIGQPIGTVSVRQNGRVLAQLPIVASQAVESNGLSHAILRVLEHWRAS